MFYRCVPEEKCKSGGFDEDDYDIEAAGTEVKSLFLIIVLEQMFKYQYLVSLTWNWVIIFIFKEWSCDATTGLRTFVENERKKSNGNVCCRSSVSVRSEDDDYEYEKDEYESDDNNDIDYDTESKKSYCSERSGYRYTNKDLSI